MTEAPARPVPAATRRGRRLQLFTIGWNCLESLIALPAGFLAGSAALVGFGFDSLIEVTSGAAVLWRLHSEHERADGAALRIVGVCFAALGVYVAQDSIRLLIAGAAPERSLVGIALAAVSVVVMPLLARAKREVGAALGSAAVNADARQTDFCAWLSAILLGGLALNALFGWWWADPAAALLMTPIIVKESWSALRGRDCGCGSGAID